MSILTDLPPSSNFPIYDLPIFRESLVFLKANPIIFILLNIFLGICLIVSIARWEKGTKNFKKITNRYNADGEKKIDTRAPINFELLAVLFLIINLAWIVVQVIVS